MMRARLRFRMGLQSVHRIWTVLGGDMMFAECVPGVYTHFSSPKVCQNVRRREKVCFERVFGVLAVLPNRFHVAVDLVTITPPVPMLHRPAQHVLGFVFAMKPRHRSTRYRISVAIHLFSRLKGAVSHTHTLSIH